MPVHFGQYSLLEGPINRVRQASWGLPLILLPLWPLGASVALVGLGLFSLRLVRPYRPLWFGLALFAGFGVVSQLLSPPLPQPKVLPWPGPSAKVNLLPANIISCMVGFNLPDTQVPSLIRRSGVFWRMPRANPVTGVPFVELYLTYAPTLQAGQTYTQSVFFRHDGTAASFEFTFFTARGHHPVPTRVVDLGGGMYRAYATYQAREGDRFVRGLDLLGLSGDWSYIEFAYPQLELSPTPSAYTPAGPPRPLLPYRVLWFVGTALLGLLALAGAQRVLAQTGPDTGRWLLVGMGLTVALVLFQLHVLPVGAQARAAALTGHPNLLGHLAVMCVGLVMLCGQKRPTALAFAIALALIWFSGSRGALLGLVPLLLFWVYTLGRGWRALVFTLIVLASTVAVDLGSTGTLGRFSTIFDPSYSTTVSRIGIWQVAEVVSSRYPWTGGGLGSLPLWYELEGSEQATEIFVQHAHNLLLELLAEAGWLGLMGCMGLLLGIAWELYQRRAWSGLMVWATALLLNVFDYSLFSEVVYYPLWIVTAWSLVMLKTSVALPVTIPE